MPAQLSVNYQRVVLQAGSVNRDISRY